MKNLRNKKSANHDRKHLSIKKLTFTLYTIVNVMSILARGGHAGNMMFHFIITEILAFTIINAISSININDIKVLFED